MIRNGCAGSEDGGVTEHYDVIIVGSAERGDFLTRETDNWDPGAVFVDGTYISPDTWYDADGKPFQPQVHHFGELKHADRTRIRRR